MAEAFDWSNYVLGGRRSPFGAGNGFSFSFPTKAKEPSFSDRMTQQEGLLRNKATDIESEETRRYERGRTTAGLGYDDLKTSLAQQVDPDLLFSRATDPIGARTTANLDALRRSIGIRGIGANSGAANGMLQRLLFNRDNAITGATADVAIENQQARQRNAATTFAAALNLANYENSPVSQIGYDTEQNVFEGLLAKYGIDQQAKAAKKAASASQAGGIIGAVGGILGGLF